MTSSIAGYRFARRLAKQLAGWVLAAPAFATLALHSGTASAQDKTFYLDRIQVAGAPDDLLATWRPYVAEKTRLYGSATLGYTLNALRASTVTDNSVVEENMGNPVRHQTIMYLQAGGELSKRLGFELQLPLSLTDGGDLNPAQVGTYQTGFAVSDLRASLRLVGYESDDRKFRFGGGGALFFPTGNDERFASDDQTTAYIYASLENDFGPFMLAANLGPHFRPHRGINEQLQSSLSIGNELRASVGAFMFLRDGTIRLAGELFGTTGIESLCKGTTQNCTSDADKASTFFAAENTSYEWLASGRLALDKNRQAWATLGGGTQITGGYGAPNFRLLAQIGWWTTVQETKATGRVRVRADVEPVAADKDTDGDGFPDSIDLCPTVPEDKQQPRPDDGCPGISDRDKDGIPDAEDSCPDDPEDKDQIEDEDGCPEDDADNDGIPDTKDACPLKPGVRSDDPALNGCPAKKRKKIIETDGEIKLLEPIQFETGKSTIKDVSFPILDEVVDLMKSRDEIRVGVYGHTDSRGGLGFNTRLSKDRAAAVMKYLVDHGIAAKRLESEGFGPTKPIDSNDTDEGRAKNRRVEFKILEK